MSLMQLLTVGRSFLTVQDRPSPYRMTEQGLLPRFERRASGASGLAERTERATRPPAPTGERAVSRGGRRRSWGLWGSGSARGRGGEGGDQPVQGELALDSVRVVRNDLMETDFEVVPVPVEAPEARGGRIRQLIRRIFG